MAQPEFVTRETFDRLQQSHDELSRLHAAAETALELERQLRGRKRIKLASQVDSIYVDDISIEAAVSRLKRRAEAAETQRDRLAALLEKTVGSPNMSSLVQGLIDDAGIETAKQVTASIASANEERDRLSAQLARKLLENAALATALEPAQQQVIEAQAETARLRAEIMQLFSLLNDLLVIWDPAWEPGKSLHSRVVAALAEGHSR